MKHKAGVMTSAAVKTVSIVTPVHNNLQGLIRLLASLERLTWPKNNLSLIICNDASTDETEEYFHKTEFDFKVILKSTPRQSGPASARNLGLEDIKSDLILFLDSDVEVAPDLIERHVELYENPKIVAVRGESLTPPTVKTSKWLRYLDSDLRGPRKLKQARGGTPLGYDKVNTNNFSIRSAVLNQGLRFDENIVHYGGEDMVFAYQLTLLELGEIVYQPQALTFHQQNSLAVVLKKLEEYGEKTLPYLLKNYPDIYPRLVLSRFYQADGKTEKIFWSRILFNRPGSLFFLGVKNLLPDRLAFRVYQYLMAWHVLRGYRRQLVKS